MDDRVIAIVTAEDGHQPLVDTIDELVANADRETFVSRKGLHGIHHALIIRECWGANDISVGVLIGLLDVLESRLGLI